MSGRLFRRHGRITKAAAAGLLTAGLALGGEVIWDATKGCLWVRNFPEETPATIDDLVRADRAGGWGKVTHDPATDTCAVKAPLWIGLDRGLGTYFQLGRTNHPRETLRVKGDVWVYPQRPSLKRRDGKVCVANRLTFGIPNRPDIQATLKIVCDKPGQYGLMVGDDRTKQPAELSVYHGTITADIPDREHALAGHFWCCTDVQLIKANLAWIDGNFMYGVQAHNSRIEGCVFEHGGSVLKNGRQMAKDCLFRDVGTAVEEGGCLDATLIRCVFASNDWNWTLGGYDARDLELIDCMVGPQKRPLWLRKNTVPQSPVPYPACTEWISLVAQVQDRRGRSVEAAFVNVRCGEDSRAVRNGLAITDRQGLTPANFEQGALLIARRRLQATDDPDRPHHTVYLYTVTVEAAGFKPFRTVLASGQDIPRPWVVRLEKPGWFAGCGKK